MASVRGQAIRLDGRYDRVLPRRVPFAGFVAFGQILQRTSESVLAQTATGPKQDKIPIRIMNAVSDAELFDHGSRSALLDCFTFAPGDGAQDFLCDGNRYNFNGSSFHSVCGLFVLTLRYREQIQW